MNDVPMKEDVFSSMTYGEQNFAHLAFLPVENAEIYIVELKKVQVWCPREVVPNLELQTTSGLWSIIRLSAAALLIQY